MVKGSIRRATYLSGDEMENVIARMITLGSSRPPIFNSVSLRHDGYRLILDLLQSEYPQAQDDTPPHSRCVRFAAVSGGKGGTIEARDACRGFA